MLRFLHKMLALGTLALGLVSPIHAQTRVQIPTSTQQTLPRGSAIGGSVAQVPPTGTSPVIGAPSLGAPSFDPYSNAASSPPSLFPSTAPPYSSSAPVPGGSAVTVPGTTYPSTGFPGTYQSQPSVMFPNGMMSGVPDWCQPQEGRYLRLFQDLRVQQTWLMGGDGPRELGIDQTEIGTTVNFPNFLWSNQPLHVSPVFAVDWWDGPAEDGTTLARGTFPTDSPPPGPYGLPPQAYAAYLAFAWQPQITPQLSADLETSVGVYTDFDGFTSDSVRFQGTALGVLAMTPTTTLKLGVTYLDRVDIKLLPAGGVVWTPNPQTRWDIYFPRPKLARYLSTVGNTDIWFYVNGEYGGGSWTIGEEAVDRRVDINDIRIGGGLEWTHQFGLYGFFEAAYVFNRELVFAADETHPYSLNDTLMIRGGLAY